MVLKSYEAIYDGQVIRPDEPLKLEPNTRIRITVTPVKVKPGAIKKNSFLAVARALKLSGPTDLAENLDDYLYGGKNTDEA